MNFFREENFGFVFVLILFYNNFCLFIISVCLINMKFKCSYVLLVYVYVLLFDEYIIYIVYGIEVLNKFNKFK